MKRFLLCSRGHAGLGGRAGPSREPRQPHDRRRSVASRTTICRHTNRCWYDYSPPCRTDCDQSVCYSRPCYSHRCSNYGCYSHRCLYHRCFAHRRYSHGRYSHGRYSHGRYLRRSR